MASRVPVAASVAADDAQKEAADALAAPLAKALLEAGSIDAVGLSRATALAASAGVRLDRALFTLGLVEELELLRHLAAVLGIDVVADPARLALHRAAVDALGLSYLSLHTIVPVEGEGGDCQLLTADPADPAVLAEVAFQLERPVRPLAAPRHAIRKLIDGAEAAPDGEASATQTLRDRSTFAAQGTDGPVVKFVADRLGEAIALGASDIHFSSVEGGLSIRIRVNGILVPQRVAASVAPVAVFARLKVLAGMNVAERRRPQDGRMTAVVAGRVIDFRVSALPTQQGESMVCRILDPRALRLGWDKLGFSAEVEAAVRRIVEAPNGLFLVTGPTGSGKTTTLYTALAHLNDGRRKIVTVEDPVEYQIDGIDQVQVHEDIGLTFGTVLRSILRQDPNVIMIGEIRDGETAEIACRAALVGRMVLSTLHTSSADGAFARLTDLGVDGFIVRDVLRGVLGQELAVVACAGCGGVGCEACGGTGSVGRALRAELRAS